MTPEDVLAEVFDRIAASQAGRVHITAEEMDLWPNEAVAALKKQKLIRKTRQASNAVCPGCEEECLVQVHAVSGSAGAPALFAVCDKREDINRVEIPGERLTQWRGGVNYVAEFVAAELGLRFSDKRFNENTLLEVGLATGDKRSQILCLGSDGGLSLVAGASSIPLAGAVRYNRGSYILDKDMIRLLVDASTTGDARYTPSVARREARKLDTKAMHEGWQKDYRRLKKERPGRPDTWYARQISKSPAGEGRSPETIRKNMKP